MVEVREVESSSRTSRSELVIASELARIDSTDSGLRVVVMGELAESLHDQSGVSGHLECDDAISECALRARFERVNDYIDRAQAGHIVASFRTDENDSESFRRLAANLERYGSGPMECVRVSSDCVSTPYSSCSSQYRCGIRLPE